jgi:hypothetical protein
VEFQDRETREQFVHMANQLFKIMLDHFPEPITKDGDIQKCNFSMSLHIHWNKPRKDVRGGDLGASASKNEIYWDDSANQVRKSPCVMCRKMISGEKLTAKKIRRCAHLKIIIWPELARAGDKLLKRDLRSKTKLIQWSRYCVRSNPAIFAIVYYKRFWWNDWCDRLELKYMHQQFLMRMPRTFISKNYLSSHVVSIAFIYFLNSAHPSLKYDIQFLLIQTPQNPLQVLKNWSSSTSWIRSNFLLIARNK